VFGRADITLGIGPHFKLRTKGEGCGRGRGQDTHVFWATVLKTVRPTLSDRSVFCLSCLSCLSMTFVHCSQKIGPIKMKLGVQIGFRPGHIVLGGDPAPPFPKGHSPPIFGPYLLRPNGCMDQDVT